MHFTIYSRSYCHLCDDLLQSLRTCVDTDTCVIDVVDVDADPELVARYDELVPVLIAQKNGHDPVQLCHYFLDEAKLRAFLVS